MQPIIFVGPGGAYVYDPTAESREDRVRKLPENDPLLVSARVIPIPQAAKASRFAN
jgi:hypothetical protein